MRGVCNIGSLIRLRNEAETEGCSEHGFSELDGEDEFRVLVLGEGYACCGIGLIVVEVAIGEGGTSRIGESGEGYGVCKVSRVCKRVVYRGGRYGCGYIGGI